MFEQVKREWRFWAVVSALLILYWWFSDDFGQWSVNAPPLAAGAVHMLTDVYYLGLLAVLWVAAQEKWRAVVGSLIIGVVAEIVSWLHVVSLDGSFTATAGNAVYLDAVVWRAWLGVVDGLNQNVLLFGKEVNLAVFVLYVPLCLLLLIVARWVLGRNEFVRDFQGEFGFR